jgi:hypothetical protein
LRRRLIPLQARLGRLLRRGQDDPDRMAVALCRQLQKWWSALWTFSRVEDVQPTKWLRARPRCRSSPRRYCSSRDRGAERLRYAY